MGDEMILPDNMTEEEVLNIVRDLMGEDMTDQDLRNAYNSGCFKELCPDIVNYAAGKKPSDDSPEGKSAKSSEEPQPGPSKNKDERKPESHSKSSRNKDDADSESESIASTKHSHHKKKKKKHSKDHKRDKSDKDHKKVRDKEQDERKEKHKSTESKEVPKPKLLPPKVVDLSDSEDERKKEKHRKEKKRVVVISSSDSESDREQSKHKIEQITTSKEASKKDHSDTKENTDAEKPKVHPFYQDKSNEPGVSQPSTKVPHEPQHEKTVEKKKEPKPFTKYNASISQVNLRKWRPVLHKEHLKYQRKFRLKPVSIVCVDLLDFPMVFYNPRKHSKNPNPISVPLLSGVSVSETRLEMIKRLERDKSNWFKKKINKRALKFLRGGKSKRMSDSSDDDDRHHKKLRKMDRVISTSDTNSDSSSVMMPNKKPRQDLDNHRGGKMSKAEREAEAKRRKLEDLKRKVDKFSKKGTRLLPWENKDAYFNNKKKDDPLKEKEKLIAEKRKRQEELRKNRMEKQKNAPTVSFQRILKQIETANKEQADKPKVQLKIPRKNHTSNRPVPMSEYKLDGRIGVGDVYKEVTKLLSSNVLVECPVMAGASDDLGEYTVKKISWWLLKNEKDPAERGAYHPECHDDDDMESIHSDDFDWPDDVSSINGCVSDPDGTAADIPPDPKKVQDPDWADDYCGEASLYARIRKETKDAAKNVGLDSVENMRSFLRTKPGTNYSKPNFEVKCFICNELLKGQRQFGAHIRSDSHKNNFRNYSLDMASYEENIEIPDPKKYYVAKLVEYSVDSSTGNTTTTSRADESVETKHEMAKLEGARSDSPGPIVGGDAAPNIMVQEMPIPDDISLPSIQNYDISSDESLQNVRVAIRTTERWDDDLERKWRTWKDEEAKIAEEYNGERDFFIMEPERHPNYQEEWLKYWDQKCTELEAQGMDTENYNFHKDWMGVWLTRMQEIMMNKVEQRVAELKTSLGIDKHTLRRRFGVSREDTRRKIKKKRGKKLPDDDLCSSIKSSVKVGSSPANGPRPVQPSALQQRNNNNVHNSKPECLPTPPVTDEDRNNRAIAANGDGGSPPPKEIKSENRLKHDKHDKRHNHDDDDRRKDRRKDDHRNDRRHRDKHCDDKHRRSKSKDHKHSNDKYDHDHRDRDRNEKRHRKDDMHSSRNDRRHRDDKHNHRDKKEYKVKEEKDNVETVSPQSPHNLDSAEIENLKQETKSECSISSAEPPPPGEEPKLLDSSSKPGRPTAPVISDRYSSKAKEMNERIETKLKVKLETRNESSNLNAEPYSHHSKLNENSNSNSIDQTKSKNVTSWSYNNSSDGEKDRPDNSSDVSTASGRSNARHLQEQLKELRKQLGRTTTDDLKRPKVIPLERTNDETNLEDGEVGSDLSDLDMHNSKGVATFVNKIIPGREDLNKAVASSSTNNLSKNSIGYELLERKKSLDESNSNDRKYERRDGSKSHKDGKHEKSRSQSHSSKHHDRDRNKHNNKSSFKDDSHRWNNKDTRNYNNKGNRGHNDHGRGGNRNVSKRGGGHNQPFGNDNRSHYTNNVTTSFADDSWATEESWEPVEQLPTPVPLFPPVPDNTSLIPVLDSSRPPQHHQPYNQPLYNPQQGSWDSGSGWGTQGYPPQNGYNNY